MKTKILLLCVFGFVKGPATAVRDDNCSRVDYLRCVKMAEPLLTESNLIFPDSKRRIDDMCNSWGQFVDCVRGYTNLCFTENQKEEFSKAVESPISSAHQMCTDQLYQQEYLKHATCIHSTINGSGGCSQHYRNLLDRIIGDGKQENLCCFHNLFRDCVINEAKRVCGYGDETEDAVKFLQNILTKALSFLHAHCSQYTFDPQTCKEYSALFSSISNHTIPRKTEKDQQTEDGEVRPQPRWQITSPDKETRVASSPWAHNNEESVKQRSGTVSKVSDNSESGPRREGYGRSNSQPAANEPWYPGIRRQQPQQRFDSNEVDSPHQQGLSNTNKAHISRLNLVTFSILCVCLAFL